MSFYKKTTLIRNMLLLAFALAFLAVVLKLVASAREIRLFQEAAALYKENKLDQAVERFAQSQKYDAITYGDPAIRASLSALDHIHGELADIDSRLTQAHEANHYKLLLETYHSYAEIKTAYSKKTPAQQNYFQQISAQLGIEKNMSNYFLQQKERFESQLATNLKKENYKDESFIPNLLAMPDEYFDGSKEKELTALLKDYDRKKFRAQKETESFDAVVANTAESLQLYQDNRFDAPWLVDLLEQYGLTTLTRESADIDAFIRDAKIYQQIKNVLPAASDVLSLIDRKIDSFFTRAEQYVNRNAFDKAIELYQSLDAYKSTASYLSQLQDRWLEHDPLQLLQKQYPDKRFSSVLAGKDRYGVQLFAAGVSDDMQLYYAAKFADGNVRYWNAALDNSLKVKKLSLSETIAESEQLVFLVEATSPKRNSTYIGLALNPSSMKTLFEVEADGLRVEQPGLLVFDNPVGEGEGLTEAPYQLQDSTLSYIGTQPDEGGDDAEGSAGDTDGNVEQGSDDTGIEAGDRPDDSGADGSGDSNGSGGNADNSGTGAGGYVGNGGVNNSGGVPDSNGTGGSRGNSGSNGSGSTTGTKGSNSSGGNTGSNGSNSSDGSAGTNGSNSSGGNTGTTISGNSGSGSSSGKPANSASAPKQLVIQAITDVHAAPDAGSEVIGQVTAGDTLQSDAEKSGWYRIVYNGATGWIKP